MDFLRWRQTLHIQLLMEADNNDIFNDSEPVAVAVVKQAKTRCLLSLFLDLDDLWEDHRRAYMAENWLTWFQYSWQLEEEWLTVEYRMTASCHDLALWWPSDRLQVTVTWLKWLWPDLEMVDCPCREGRLGIHKEHAVFAPWFKNLYDGWQLALKAVECLMLTPWACGAGRGIIPPHSPV